MYLPNDAKILCLAKYLAIQKYLATKVVLGTKKTNMRTVIENVRSQECSPYGNVLARNLDGATKFGG